MCPAGAIEPPGGDPHPFLPRLDADACVDCGLCERVCPTLRQPATFAARQEAPTPLKRAVLAHAADEELRRRAASGGAVTALVLAWLGADPEHQALVILPSRSGPHGLFPEATITADPERVRQACGSHYCSVPTLHLLRDVPRERLAKLLVVGLPCEVRALRQWAREQGLQMGPLVGLFCAGAKDYRYLFWLLRCLRVAPQRVRHFTARCGQFPGGTVAELEDGSRRTIGKYEPPSEYSWRNATFAYRACLFCPDPSAEEADLACGDPWLLSAEPGAGLTLVYVRTDLGERLVEEACGGMGVGLGIARGEGRGDDERVRLVVECEVKAGELGPRVQQDVTRGRRAGIMRGWMVGDEAVEAAPLRARLRPLVLYVRWRVSSSGPVAWLLSALPPGVMGLLSKLRL